MQLPAEAKENFRRLAGWQRIPLNPGESRKVTVAMEPLALAVFNETADDWQWLGGEYTVSVGPSSRDLPLTSKASLRR